MSDAPEPVERTGRSAHEWRASLLVARKTMVLAAQSAIHERFLRDNNALEQFEKTMTFAKRESVIGLLMDGILGSLDVPAPQPLWGILQTINIATHIYSAADAASQNVVLDTWIQAHRDAIELFRETQIGPDSHPAFIAVGRLIDSLVSDTTDAGEKRKQELELGMLNATFPVTVTSQEIEMQLYESWCSNNGGHFVALMYRTGREYPGSEELGGGGGGHPAFGDRQIVGEKVPPKILDRLQRLGLDPIKALRLPVEEKHYVRGNAYGDRGPALEGWHEERP